MEVVECRPERPHGRKACLRHIEEVRWNRCSPESLPTALPPSARGDKIHFDTPIVRGPAPLVRGAHRPTLQPREPVGRHEGRGGRNSAENGPLWPENDSLRRCVAAHLLGDLVGLEGRCGWWPGGCGGAMGTAMERRHGGSAPTAQQCTPVGCGSCCRGASPPLFPLLLSERSSPCCCF